MTYALVATFCAALTGFSSYQNNLKHEIENRKDEIRTISTRLSGQMDDTLNQMDASMNYILSEPDLLNSIIILGKTNQLPQTYITDAENVLKKGITTDFITRNGYRTLFYNRSGKIIFSSDRSGSRIISTFDIDSIEYLSRADAAKGKPILVTAHEDFWNSENNKMTVYSLVKAIQGCNMGYLEVENTVEDLKELQKSAEGMDFQIYVNDGQLLYSSNPKRKAARRYLDFSWHQNKLFDEDEELIASHYSGKYSLSVLVVSDKSSLAARQNYILLYSFLQAILAFAISFAFVVICSFILVKPIRKMQNIIDNTDLQNLGNVENIGVRSEHKDEDEIQSLLESYQIMTERLNWVIIKERKASVLHLQALFDSLQAQVNPHFLYNVLNTLSARGMEDNDDVICDICTALANMLRYSTSNKERYTQVKNELHYLQDYFYLMKARYEDRLVFEYHIPDELMEQKIPKITLQQIAENSINHGFENQNTVMKIEIIGYRGTDRWYIRIRDNGTGFSKAVLAEIRRRMGEIQNKILAKDGNIELEIGGMGLVNTYARCRLLYGKDCIFQIRNMEHGAGAEVIVGAFFTDGGNADVQGLCGGR